MMALHCVMFICLVIGIAQITDALLCYQCAISGADRPCITDMSGFYNTSLKLTKKYFKDCTATNPHWDRCVIETAESGGIITLFNRDCHDGLNFTEGFDDPKFRNLPANNYTTCVQKNLLGKLVCYTFCATDFCNGPQPPPTKTCNETELEYGDVCGATAMTAYGVQGLLCFVLAAFVSIHAVLGGAS
ncbi:unnamed protein product [Lymnaea stagnalis]|uniref:Protein quiver n=1 Tax=Lymnaea stagnalis TaxID=6523 RepID=A0AAV2HU53_LYMST